MGRRQQPYRLRAGHRRRDRASDHARGAGALGRQGALLRAAGAGSQAEEPAAHPGAVPVDGRELPPRVRPLSGEMAQSGRGQDAVRRTGNGRHLGQQPRDDAREEQRRHRQVHRQLARHQRAARPRREHVACRAAEDDPDFFSRGHRAQRRLPRRGRVLG